MLENYFKDILLLENPAILSTLWEALFAMVISFALGIAVSWTYARVCKGHSPSQPFMHALIIMTVVITIVIIAVGSNVARAFSLAGALSIIRFRSVVHGPKDVAFIFFAMGSGLAAGTGLYILAVVFTVLLCALILGLDMFNYGGSGAARTLKITLSENLAHHGLFDDVFKTHLDMYNMIAIHTIRQGTMFELTYQVRLKHQDGEKELIDEIRTINGNLSVALLLAPSE